MRSHLLPSLAASLAFFFAFSGFQSSAQSSLSCQRLSSVKLAPAGSADEMRSRAAEITFADDASGATGIPGGNRSPWYTSR